MAAGLGTRLRPFTDMEPKALLPMMGVPMAQFAFDSLACAGVKKIVANVHHHAERARDGLEALERDQAELVISDESGELLGSAGGIRKALPHFNSAPFFLLNADVLCDVNLQALARVHLRLRQSAGVKLTLTVFPSPPLGVSGVQREKYREIVFDPQTQLITGLGEPMTGRPYFVGAAVVEPDALSAVPEAGPAEFVPSILLPAIREGKAGVFMASGAWHDVGSPTLWLETHLELIRALETGRLSRQWRTRIEKTNRRLSSLLWTSKDASTRELHVSDWAGPSYWNPLGDSTAGAPESFGSNAVFYGNAQGVDSSLSDGIGFRGVWTSLRSSFRPE